MRRLIVPVMLGLFLVFLWPVPAEASESEIPSIDGV